MDHVPRGGGGPLQSGLTHSTVETPQSLDSLDALDAVISAKEGADVGVGLVDSTVAHGEEMTESSEREICFAWVTLFLRSMHKIPAESAESPELVPLPEDWPAVAVTFEKEIYTYGWHRLVRYIQSPSRPYQMSNKDEVQDLATESCQEATIKFVRRLSRLWPTLDFASMAHLRAYFFVAAKHSFVDIMRKREKRQKPPAPPKKVALIKQLKESHPALEEMAMETLEEKVKEWIAVRVTEADKALLVGRFFVSPARSYKAIAEELNEQLSKAEGQKAYTVGQLRVRRHRLVRDLSRWLQEELTTT